MKLKVVLIDTVMDLNSTQNLNSITKLVLCLSFVILAQSNLFCFNYARSGHFMLRRQETPAELIKILFKLEILFKGGTEHADCTES